MRIIITGKNSYVGNNIKNWLERNNDHQAYELDMLDDNWKSFDFSSYDTVVHVAAIVHKSKQDIDWENYYKVNTILPIEVAKKAKESGVKLFVFLSTMGVYGQEKKLPNGNVISATTALNPTNFYGKSKLMAEQLLKNLEDDNFKIAIIRPPNVYGKNCPGNYLNNFLKITRWLPVFPLIYEKSLQSFIYIDNLTQLIKLIIETNSNGIYTPQDDIRISTPEYIEIIAKAINKRMHFSRILGLVVCILSRSNIVRKIYGGISYSDEISKTSLGSYLVCSLNDGIKKSV